jgi:hypothetical protein
VSNLRLSEQLFIIVQGFRVFTIGFQNLRRKKYTYLCYLLTAKKCGSNKKKPMVYLKNKNKNMET